MRTKLLINKLLYLLILLLISCSEAPEVVEISKSEWSFVVFGDVQDGFTNYCPIAQQISNIKPTPVLAVNCGDVTYTTGVKSQWDLYWKCSEPIIKKMPLFIVRGNHEGNDSISEKAFREMGRNHREKFYLSYITNGTLFVILDTYIRDQEYSITGNQLKWLTNQLNYATSKASINYIFLFMHMSPFPQGWHSANPLYNADALHQLFIKHKKIKAIFAGHEHVFNRFVKDSLNYITTGGGGGDLNGGYGGDYYHFTKVTIDTGFSKINIKTISPEGIVIDDFEI